jgi:hypothetical protein
VPREKWPTHEWDAYEAAEPKLRLLKPQIRVTEAVGQRLLAMRRIEFEHNHMLLLMFDSGFVAIESTQEDEAFHEVWTGLSDLDMDARDSLNCLAELVGLGVIDETEAEDWPPKWHAWNKDGQAYFDHRDDKRWLVGFRERNAARREAQEKAR